MVSLTRLSSIKEVEGEQSSHTIAAKLSLFKIRVQSVKPFRVSMYVPDAMGFPYAPSFSQLLDHHHRNLWKREKVPVSGLSVLSPGKPGDSCGPSKLKQAFVPSIVFIDLVPYTQPGAKR